MTPTEIKEIDADFIIACWMDGKEVRWQDWATDGGTLWYKDTAIACYSSFQQFIHKSAIYVVLDQRKRQPADLWNAIGTVCQYLKKFNLFRDPHMLWLSQLKKARTMQDYLDYCERGFWQGIDNPGSVRMIHG